MPAAARVGDTVNTGHGCSVTVPIVNTTQTKVKINGILAAVIGDPLAPHTILIDGNCVPHEDPAVTKVLSGSSLVSIEGKAAARVGDLADLGSIITGSPNVIIGG